MNKDDLKAIIDQQLERVSSLGPKLASARDAITSSPVFNATLGSRLGKSLYKKSIGKVLRDPFENPYGPKDSLAMMGTLLSTTIDTAKELPGALRRGEFKQPPKKQDDYPQVMKERKRLEGIRNKELQDIHHWRSVYTQEHGGKFKDINGGTVRRSSTQDFNKQQRAKAVNREYFNRKNGNKTAEFNAKYSNYSKNMSDHYRNLSDAPAKREAEINQWVRKYNGLQNKKNKKVRREKLGPKPKPLDPVQPLFSPYGGGNNPGNIVNNNSLERTVVNNNKTIGSNISKAKKRVEIQERARALREERGTRASPKLSTEREQLRSQAFAAVREARSDIAKDVKGLSATRKQITPGTDFYKVTNPNIENIKAPYSPAIRTSLKDAVNHANRPEAVSGLQRAWDSFKEFTKPLWGDGVDREADNVTRAFTGLAYDKGVKGFTPDLDGISNLSEKERDNLIRGNRNEASKHVRDRGANVDPFLDSQNNRRDQRRADKKDQLRSSNEQMNLSNERASLINKRADMFHEANLNPERASTPIAFDENGKITRNPNLAIDGFEKAGDRINGINSRMSQNQKILDYQSRTTYTHGKTFRPSEGVGGYGLGFANHMKASRAELFVRGTSFALTLTGGGEALMNAFGVRTAIQKSQMKKQTSIFKKLMTPGGQAIAGTWGSLLYTAASGGEMTDFVETQLSYAAGLQGWRTGTSFGGMLGGQYVGSGGKMSAKGVAGSVGRGISAGAGRGALTLVGGATGFALGLAAVQGASWMAHDLTSNKSSIRKIAKEFTTRTATMNTADNYKTLTSRQAALNKLAKSGLNDRAILLGNEARVLKGLM